MISRIQIEKLFGLYDYDITISANPAVKILTGPNGYGKTTLLLAIDHLYKGDFWYFHFLSFDKIVLTLSEQIIEIVKSVIGREGSDTVLFADDTDEDRYEEEVRLLDKEGKVIETVAITDIYIQELLSICRRKLMRELINVKDEELIAGYYDAEDDDYIQTHSKNISLALQEYDTKYLPAQRVYNHFIDRFLLYRPLRSGYHYEIDHVNDEISRLYRRTQNEFASASQRIDATFISRLMKRSDFYAKADLQVKLKELRQRIDGYKELNLFTNMELLDYSLDDDKSYDEYKKVLSLYVDDMNAKMDRFEKLYQKISLYKRLITSKVLSEKKIYFSEDGFTVMNVKGRKLNDLHKLSSGEQNLLILYYNLIFRSNGKTILLIDEPENSLHVAWQSRMLDDYIEMANTTGCQILMATHSPTLIDGRWELTTDLYRQNKERGTE